MRSLLDTSLKVRFDREGEIAVISIANPPINAGSARVRAGLLEAIGRLTSDATLTAAVLIGHADTIMGGSDLREFNQPKTGCR